MTEKPYWCNVCGIESIQDPENEDERKSVGEMKLWEALKIAKSALGDIGEGRSDIAGKRAVKAMLDIHMLLNNLTK